MRNLALAEKRLGVSGEKGGGGGKAFQTFRLGITHRPITQYF